MGEEASQLSMGHADCMRERVLPGKEECDLTLVEKTTSNAHHLTQLDKNDGTWPQPCDGS